MSAEYALAVDVGATNIRTAIGNEKGRVLESLSQPSKARQGRAAISKQIIHMIQSIIEEGFNLEDVRGVGIGSIGPLDPVKGVITKGANIPYEQVPLVEPLRQTLNLPVYLQNDCTAAVMGEKMFGAGKNVENLVYVTLSTGIGGGAYVDGHLLLGKEYNAVEVGHTTVDFDGRLRCGCGRKGHWESYCSGRNIPNYVRLILTEKDQKEWTDSLLARLSGQNQDKITARLLFQAARGGDQLSKEIVSRIGRLNAVGFANIVDAYDPSLITVGGTVALRNADLILGPIRAGIGEHAINTAPRIELTPLGGEIVLLGALAMAFNPPRTSASGRPAAENNLT